MSTLVTIIVPTYNCAHLISDTLNSVNNQTYTNWECIVVDDGSNDNTEALLETYIEKDNRFQYYKRPEHKPKGANACRNFGFSLSKGDYTLFLDADDLLRETCLENRVKAFKQSSAIEAVVADTALWINDNFKDTSINNDPKDENDSSYLKQFLSYQLPWTSTLSVLWKRDTITEITFDESLLRLQDIDFHINILKRGCHIYRLKEIDNYYRVATNKIFNQQHIDLVLTNLLVFFNKHISWIVNHNDHKLAFRKFINYFLRHYIFPNYQAFKAEATQLLNHIKESGLFTNKQLRLIKTQEFLVKTKLNKTKYIGMYRLSNYINKELENS